MKKHVVGPVASFAPGTGRRVEVEGRGIAIFNTDGKFFALRDVCPHQGARLSEGCVWGFVTASAPGAYEYEGSRQSVRCPWHGWEYDLATGQSWHDPPNDYVRRYDASVEPGKALGADPPLANSVPPGRVPGPYVAETIEISLEDDYVVVTL